MVETGHFAGTDDVFKDTVSLKHDVLAVTDFDFPSDDGIDEGQFRQFAVEEVRHGFEHLSESGFLDEHGIEDSVLRIRFGILSYSSSGERPVADIHSEKQVIHRLFPVHGKYHMLGFMLHDGSDESEDVVDMVRADIVFEMFGFFAA